MYHTEPLTDKKIREWYIKFQQSGCLCAAKRTGRPMAFGRPVHAMFRHDFPTRGETCKYATAPSTQKTWRDSLHIDMLLSVLSVLVVEQPSSEIPVGLMNYPVCTCGKLFAATG
jgi:hypothetical protein